MKPSFAQITNRFVSSARRLAVVLVYSIVFTVAVSMLSNAGFAQPCIPASTAAGSLDTCFGMSGGVITQPPLATDLSSIATRDMVIQGDGKILVLAGARDTNAQGVFTFSGALVRFMADGSIDAAFGTGGFLYLTWDAPKGSPMKIAKQVVNGEERYVIAGADNCSSGPCVRAERYTAAGARDNTFGTGGVTTINTGTWNMVNAVAIQGDQKILIGGLTNPIVRLNANGTADTGFGKKGISATKSGIGIYALKVLSNGKILAAGTIWAGTANKFSVGQFNSNGTLDTTFGTGGKTSVYFAGKNDFAIDLTVDAAGKILVCGEATLTDTVPAASGYDAALVRLSPNGTLDTTFGAGGKTTLDIGGAQDEFTTVSIQANGQIVLTGEGRLPGHKADVLIARYNTNGTLDTTFGFGGWNLTDIYGGYDSGRTGLIQIDPSCLCEKFVVAAVGSANVAWPTPQYIVGLRYML
jgi:uncharacterized delta-60 repeat protein